MINQDKYFKLILSDEQLCFLSSSRKLDRMRCLFAMIRLAVLEQTPYHKDTGFSTTLNVGQFVITETELANLWKCSRNAASNLLDEFNRLKLISSVQGRRTSVHTILFVSAWIVDNKQILNPACKELIPSGISAKSGAEEDAQSNTNVNN